MTERERLIRLLNNSLTGSVGLSSMLSENIADYLLAKGVVAPPCKIGDTVYTNISMQGWYFRSKNRPYSAKVVFIGLNDSKEMGYGFINVLYNDRTGCMYQFNFADIGKFVFLTREKAEQALKEVNCDG